MNQSSPDDKALSLHIEKLLVSHLDELAEVLLHPEVYEYIEEELPTLDDFKLGLERAIAGPRDRAMAESWLNYLVRDAAGIMLGRLEATVHHQLAEIAFLFGREHWGRGFASAALLWLHGELERVHGITEFWATTAPATVVRRRFCSDAAMLKRRFRSVRSLVLRLETWSFGVERNCFRIRGRFKH